jgi:LysR family glycine cleavage system transcriptional activator
MRELPLNALRAYAAVYAHGGVRPAARELRVAHSAVSRHLAELQAWLGIELLEAGAARRAPRFTAAGEALGRAALAGLGEIERAVAGLREARSVHAVTLSTTPSFAARWLLPRLHALRVAHPRLEVSVLVEQRVEDLEHAGIDVAIRMGRGRWPGVDAQALMVDALYPVMSPALWKDAGRPREPAALRGLPLLHDRDPQAAWEAWRRQHGPPGLDVRSGARFASSDLVLRAAAVGQGVALARHRLVADDLAAGTLLRPFGAAQVDLGPAYWMVRPPAARPRPAITVLVDWLQRQSAQPQTPR